MLTFSICDKICDKKYFYNSDSIQIPLRFHSDSILDFMPHVFHYLVSGTITWDLKMILLSRETQFFYEVCVGEKVV